MTRANPIFLTLPMKKFGFLATAHLLAIERPFPFSPPSFPITNTFSFLSNIPHPFPLSRTISILENAPWTDLSICSKFLQETRRSCNWILD